jgi:hypothetical protein
MEKKKPQISKELIEIVLNDISSNTNKSNRKFKAFVYFNNEEEAQEWLKYFNNLCIEELNKKYETTNNN